MMKFSKAVKTSTSEQGNRLGWLNITSFQAFLTLVVSSLTFLGVSDINSRLTTSEMIVDQLNNLKESEALDRNVSILALEHTLDSRSIIERPHHSLLLARLLGEVIEHDVKTGSLMDESNPSSQTRLRHIERILMKRIDEENPHCAEAIRNTRDITHKNERGDYNFRISRKGVSTGIDDAMRMECSPRVIAPITIHSLATGIPLPPFTGINRLNSGVMLSTSIIRHLSQNKVLKQSHVTLFKVPSDKHVMLSRAIHLLQQKPHLDIWWPGKKMSIEVQNTSLDILSILESRKATSAPRSVALETINPPDNKNDVEIVINPPTSSGEKGGVIIKKNDQVIQETQQTVAQISNSLAAAVISDQQKQEISAIHNKSSAPHVFIHYTQEDKESEVKKIAKDLFDMGEKNGISFFYDNQIKYVSPTTYTGSCPRIKFFHKSDAPKAAELRGRVKSHLPRGSNYSDQVFLDDLSSWKLASKVPEGQLELWISPCTEPQALAADETISSSQEGLTETDVDPSR